MSLILRWLVRSVKRHGYPEGGLRSEQSVQAAPAKAAEEKPPAAQAAEKELPEAKAAPEKKKGGRPKKADAEKAV